MSRLSDLESDELEVVNSTIDEFSGNLFTADFDTWSLGGSISKVINRFLNI
jgi:hypothetical protein